MLESIDHDHIDVTPQQIAAVLSGFVTDKAVLAEIAAQEDITMAIEMAATALEDAEIPDEVFSLLVEMGLIEDVGESIRLPAAKDIEEALRMDMEPVAKSWADPKNKKVITAKPMLDADRRTVESQTELCPAHVRVYFQHLIGPANYNDMTEIEDYPGSINHAAAYLKSGTKAHDKMGEKPADPFAYIIRARNYPVLTDTIQDQMREKVWDDIEKGVRDELIFRNIAAQACSAALGAEKKNDILNNNFGRGLGESMQSAIYKLLIIWLTEKDIPNPEVFLTERGVAKPAS